MKHEIETIESETFIHSFFLKQPPKHHLLRNDIILAWIYLSNFAIIGGGLLIDKQSSIDFK